MTNDPAQDQRGGKRVVIINTTGGSLKLLRSSGMFESISQTIDGGIFRFCGMEVVVRRFFVNVLIVIP
jgi:putative NADPH-quinone reductase